MLLSRLAVQARRVLAADEACVLVVDPARVDEMVVVEAQGVDDDVVGDRVPIAGELRSALRANRPHLAPSDELFAPLGAGSGAAVRIAGPAGVAGILCMARRDRARRFERCDRALLDEIATLFAATLEDARMGARLGPKISACGDELARLAGADGPGAAEDVCAIAIRVGTRFGLDEAALIELELAARLSELQGADTAHRALALTPGFEAIGLVLRLAGERWDGGGHPYGLEADRIPLASRILAACRELSDVAGAADATPFDALRCVNASSGRAFDPSVVGALWRDFCDVVASRR